ncbi:MAG: aldehyde dehydrogenase [Gloeomargarita sp. DG_2_bins_126]
MDIAGIVKKQRQFWHEGSPQHVDFRIQQLKNLRQLVRDNEATILASLAADLGKPTVEGYTAEISLVLGEIQYALRHLRQWLKPQNQPTPLSLFPGRLCIRYQPLGVVLIIAPWNYPFQLVMAPLVGAIAAGNCAILKPSELAPRTAEMMAQLIPRYFPPEYIAVVTGEPAVVQALLAEPLDHIFFTGSAAVGKIIMAQAAETLTPVTLELGGKSPCIIDRDVDLDVAVRRIVWGKFMNAGQTCVAPDYLLVPPEMKSALLPKIATCLQEFYGSDPALSPDYGRIINDAHWQRLNHLLATGRIVIGGQTDRAERYIAPTVMDAITWDDPVMQSEIFGPILPILEYTTLEAVIEHLNCLAPPLALYFFSRNRRHQQQVIAKTKSGGVCLNDTVLQFTAPQLPFGGVGASGMGRYHGKASFLTFSYPKSILSKPQFLDFRFRYPPYNPIKLRLLKWLLG